MSRWPQDDGPLAALREMRLLDGWPAPRWATGQRVTEEADGTHYRAGPPYLSSEAIRHLAALSFEGFSVNVRPASSRIHIDIWQ